MSQLIQFEKVYGRSDSRTMMPLGATSRSKHQWPANAHEWRVLELSFQSIYPGRYIGSWYVGGVVEEGKRVSNSDFRREMLLVYT